MFGLDELEQRAARRAVRAPVDERVLAVVEPAHRVEVVLLVVVERRLVTQAPPQRIRVRVDLEVVRVVVEVRGAHVAVHLEIFAEYSANKPRTWSRSSPNSLGFGVDVRLPPLGVRLPPPAHALLEGVGDGLAEPRVQPPHLADGITLHGPEVHVVEAVVAVRVAEPQQPLHPRRPVLDVELAEVREIDVLAELAAHLGVDVGDRDHDLGRVAMGHHEAGVREHLVEVVEPQQVRRALQPPRPGRRSPLQELEGPALVAVGGGQVGVEQPLGVRRHVGERLEVVGLEVERHQVLALLGPGRRARDQRRHPRGELVLHLLHRLGSRRCAGRARRRSTAAGTVRPPPSAAATARRDPRPGGSTAPSIRCAGGRGR